MVRQSEFKPRFDPELGRYAMKHIHGEGIMDVFRSVGSKLFGKTAKELQYRSKLWDHLPRICLGRFAVLICGFT